MASFFFGLIGGGLGLSVILLIFVALNPEKVQLWAAMLWRGFRKVTKSAEYGYVAIDVAAHVNSHLTTNVDPSLSGLSSRRIEVKWDNSAESVEKESAGTLIVRLRKHEDRLVNILRAYLVCSPRMYAPTVRSQLDVAQSRAIDLQMCRRLANELSASALTVYRLHILDPDLEEFPELQPLLDDFDAIDQGGLFVAVLLQELVKLGAAYPADNLLGLKGEIEAFVEFLKTLAERGAGEDVPLSFCGRWVRVNILLVARQETRVQGTGPYRHRVGLELARGVDCVYVLATKGNREFAREVAEVLDGDRRLMRQDERKTPVNRNGRLSMGIVIPFERNLGYYAEVDVSQRIDDGKLNEGSVVTSTVTDVQPSFILVDIDGVQARVPSSEWDWKFVSDCTKVAEVGIEVDVKLLEVDSSAEEVVASRRLCHENPIDSLDADEIIGFEGNFVVSGRAGVYPKRFLAGYLEGFEHIPARLLEDELDWGAPLHGVSDYEEGDKISVIVHKIPKSKQFVVCSRKRCCGDTWGEIRSRYPKDSMLEVEVDAIVREGVWCKIESGLVGFVSSDEFQRAGLEYQDFPNNLRKGQRLFVYVRRVVGGSKQRVNLGLQANL